MLCLGGRPLSLPPQCGEVPIANWDWGAVAGEKSMYGTTWGEYHVVGTYDGEVFTVTEIGPTAPVRETTRPMSTTTRAPSPREAGVVRDPNGSTQEDARPAGAYAKPSRTTSSPGWTISTRSSRSSARSSTCRVHRQGKRREAEIREVWSGPLCVVERDLPPTERS